MVMVMVRDRARFVELRTYCHISLQSIDGVSPFLPVRTKTSNWKQMGSRVAPQGAVRTRRVRLASEVEFPVNEGKVCASATDTSCSAWRRTETRAARHEDPYMSPKPSGAANQGGAKQDDAVSASWAEDDHQPGARGISAIQKSAV